MITEIVLVGVMELAVLGDGGPFGGVKVKGEAGAGFGYGGRKGCREEKVGGVGMGGIHDDRGDSSMKCASEAWEGLLNCL